VDNLTGGTISFREESGGQMGGPWPSGLPV